MVQSVDCIVLFVVQPMDRIVLRLGCSWIKIRGLKPRLPAASTSSKHRVFLGLLA
jgi:hypothetical protein